MQTVVSAPVAPLTEPQLLLNWSLVQDRSYWRTALGGTIALHVLFVILLVSMPSVQQVNAPPEKSLPRRVTPLVDPPTELTQKAPNTAKPSKNINLDSLRQPSPQVSPERTAKLTTPPTPALSPPPAPQARPQAQIPKPAEPPKLEPAVPETNRAAGILNNIPPPPVQTPQQEPKLVLETPSAPKPSPRPPSLTPPGTSVEQAVRSLSHGGGSSNAVGDLSPDLYSSTPGRIPAPGPPRAGVQLKSDPMGVDFKPYLLEVLQAVKRNWFAVMPESARLGQRGQVVLIFGVNKEGKIVKVVFSTESGARPLDRAAVAALSMSDPLPPLPAGFKGTSVALQFTFQYNAPPH